MGILKTKGRESDKEEKTVWEQCLMSISQGEGGVVNQR